MILSEHASKGNGDKLYKEYLAVLNLRPLGQTFMNILNEVGSRESDVSAKDSFIVSVTQPVSYSFACHFTCKVKYYWKIANIKMRFRGETMFFSFSHLCRYMSPTNYQMWIIVDHEHNRLNLVTRRQIASKRPKQSTQQNRFQQITPCCSSQLFLRR